MIPKKMKYNLHYDVQSQNSLQMAPSVWKRIAHVLNLREQQHSNRTQYKEEKHGVPVGIHNISHQPANETFRSAPL